MGVLRGAMKQRGMNRGLGMGAEGLSFTSVRRGRVRHLAYGGQVVDNWASGRATERGELRPTGVRWGLGRFPLASVLRIPDSSATPR